MALHRLDARARNPRMQCACCGRWSRIHLRPVDGAPRQFSYGGCGKTNGDHNAAGETQDVCDECCKEKCK